MNIVRASSEYKTALNITARVFGMPLWFLLATPLLATILIIALLFYWPTIGWSFVIFKKAVDVYTKSGSWLVNTPIRVEEKE